MAQMLNEEGQVKQDEERMKWWTDAKFGMFIHWGLYAMPGKGEWHMFGAKIPVEEYEKLADQFNPAAFDAKKWVQIAKQTGMNYIVITAKHHDGFAMYDSKTEPFNIVQATPYKRDPMKELAEACKAEGIKLCFYYSHVIDWHHPHSVHNAANNTWDYNMEEKHFPTYWNELVKPQIKELLTEYGDIGLIWFDTAGGLSYEDSLDMVNHVRSLQPSCLMNSRVSHFKGLGDYQSKGDNETPMYGEDTRPWETPMTMNETWGFSPRDQRWKSTDSLIRKLVNIVSKGGNMLLNVGPSPEGNIPPQSVERLQELGEWTMRNAEAIYGTKASPFPYEVNWGAITMKEGRLFLHVHNEHWPQGEFQVNGIASKIKRVYLLADAEQQPLVFTQTISDTVSQQAILRLNLPEQPIDRSVSVIVLEMEDSVEVDARMALLPSNELKVDITAGEVTEGHSLGEEYQGTEGIEKREEVRATEWELHLDEAGIYEVQIYSFMRHDVNFSEAYGEGIRLTLAGQTLQIVPRADIEVSDSPACQHPYTEIISMLGEVQVKEPGTYPMMLVSSLIKGRNPKFTEIWQADKVKLRAVKLVKRA
ncbi:alpha-L-fucosidase [Paenibacillus sp. 1001270B_150601_E10]|uniref:alpha-L-fucosidase n=1 Tax=Paenibacillus sp. 1001270B_150601_E10 TaxID=2787079 RepID=UPI001E631D4F|nr:alpha-L-fucosidase [Paenibacillus sp. 1001270B_150601_E10]